MLYQKKIHNVINKNNLNVYIFSGTIFFNFKINVVSHRKTSIKQCKIHIHKEKCQLFSAEETLCFGFLVKRIRFVFFFIFDGYSCLKPHIFSGNVL